MAGKPPVLPLRPGEWAMTAAPGTVVAQRRRMTTVQPGRQTLVAQDGAVQGQGVKTPAGTRHVPPLQPNASAPTVVPITQGAPRLVARVRDSQRSNKASGSAASGTATPPAGGNTVVSSLGNPLLGGNSPIGGYRQDAHAIPPVLQGTPVKA